MRYSSFWRGQTLIGIPNQLQDVIQLVSAYLSGHIPPEDREVIEDDIDYFLVHM